MILCDCRPWGSGTMVSIKYCVKSHFEQASRCLTSLQKEMDILQGQALIAWDRKTINIPGGTAKEMNLVLQEGGID